MARRFFYVCAGLLCLVIAYDFGAVTGHAQANSPVAGVTGTYNDLYGFADCVVMTPNGDVYYRRVCTSAPAPTYVGNFWAGAPTPTKQESWGRLKARYR